MTAKASDLKAALDAFLDAAERLSEEAGLDVTRALIERLFFDAQDLRRPHGPRTTRPSQAPLSEGARRSIARASRSADAWTPGTRRGRVPEWVLELAGETNSKGAGPRILERFGPVTFERGKPAPRPAPKPAT